MITKITLLSPIKIVDNIIKATASSTDAEVMLQPDLLYMRSVLVSTGANKNDDIFIPEEMWAARKTPKLKPVNWEHNTGIEITESDKSNKKIITDNQIIGVMYDSYAAGKDGITISDDVDSIPQEFDIINDAVIYKYLFPNAVSKIISGAESNALFVSMEAWFKRFDYRVGNRIVARNEQTLFLDKCLRAFGGDGVFNNEKVGRVLRDIVFGGVGIVSKPANDESIIQRITNADYKGVGVTDAAIASNIIGNINGLDAKDYKEACISMADNENTAFTTDNIAVAGAPSANQDYIDVVQKLAKAELTLETKNVELTQMDEVIKSLKIDAEVLVSAFAAGAEALAEVLGGETSGKLSNANAGEFFTILVESLKENIVKYDSLSKELQETKAKLDEIEHKKIMAERVVKMRSELGIIDASYDEKATKLFNSAGILDDIAFANWLENTKELFEIAKSVKMEKEDEEDEEDEEDKEDDSITNAADNNAEVKDEIIDASVLDSVVATESVSAGVANTSPVVDMNTKMKSLASALLQATKK